MSLSQFKEIFFWDISIGCSAADRPRLRGAAGWFAWKRAIPKGYGWRLGLLLLLGGMQGAIGWWMVASGFGRPARGQPHSPRRSPARRAADFRAADLDRARSARA
jgi:hypothetical protein